VSTTGTVASACRIYNTSDQSPSRPPPTINGLENVKNLRKCPIDFVPPALKLHSARLSPRSPPRSARGVGGWEVSLYNTMRTSNGPWKPFDANKNAVVVCGINRWWIFVLIYIIYYNINFVRFQFAFAGRYIVLTLCAVRVVLSPPCFGAKKHDVIYFNERFALYLRSA